MLKKLKIPLFLLAFSSTLFFGAEEADAATANWATGQYKEDCVYLNRSGQEQGDGSWTYTYYATTDPETPYSIPAGWTNPPTYYGDAESFSWKTCSPTYYSTEATFYASTDKNEYAPGEPVRIHVSGGSGQQAVGPDRGFVDYVINPFCSLWSCDQDQPPGVGVDAVWQNAQVAQCDQSGGCSADGGFTLSQNILPGNYTIGLNGCWYSLSFCTPSSMTITVKVAGTAPQITAVFNPKNISYGGSTYFSWGSSGADECSILDGGNNVSAPASGSTPYSGLTSGKTLTFSCSNGVGTNSETSTVEVCPANKPTWDEATNSCILSSIPFSPMLSQYKEVTTPNQSFGISWDVTGVPWGSPVDSAAKISCVVSCASATGDSGCGPISSSARSGSKSLSFAESGVYAISDTCSESTGAGYNPGTITRYHTVAEDGAACTPTTQTITGSCTEEFLDYDGGTYTGTKTSVCPGPTWPDNYSYDTSGCKKLCPDGSLIPVTNTCPGTGGLCPGGAPRDASGNCPGTGNPCPNGAPRDASGNCPGTGGCPPGQTRDLTSGQCVDTGGPAKCADGLIPGGGCVSAPGPCGDVNGGTYVCSPGAGRVCSASAPDCPQVEIKGFTASLYRLFSGGVSVLSWNSTGAKTCLITGTLNGKQADKVSVSTTGSRLTSKLFSDISSNATYTLDCSNPQNSDTKSLIIRVLGPIFREY